jgi:two-component system alkaline phosphatase synthesis response regulator PhoP
MDPDRFGELELRPDEMDVVVAGMRLGLTRREYQLLAALARRPDQVVSREELYDQVWGGQMRQRDRSVDVFVRKLRTKLSHASPSFEYIHTRFGIGYRLCAERRTNGSSPLVHQ